MILKNKDEFIIRCIRAKNPAIIKNPPYQIRQKIQNQLNSRIFRFRSFSGNQRRKLEGFSFDQYDFARKSEDLPYILSFLFIFSWNFSGVLGSALKQILS